MISEVIENMNKILTYLSILLVFGSSAVFGGNQNDSIDSKILDVSSYIKGLKGIERYYVQMHEYNPIVALQKIQSLMEYNKQSVPKLLSVVNDTVGTKRDSYKYKIVELDRRSGYMTLQCVGCENTLSLTYWNVSDGGKVIVQVSRSCGPACDSSFKTFKVNSRGYMSETTKKSVLPVYKPEDFLRDQKHAILFAEDHWEVQYKLPRKGKDIIVSLGGNDKNIFKGHSIRFKWRDGKFVPGKFFFPK